MIEKLNPHYSMTNPASIYDEEALTAIELAGRTASKVNEVVTDQNALREETETRLTIMEDVQIPEEVTTEVQEQIDNGTFDKAIGKYAGGLDEQMETIIGSVNMGSITTMDAEVINLRNSFIDYAGHANARQSIAEGFYYSMFPRETHYGDTHDLNDADLCTPGVYAFVNGATFLNAPAGVQPGEDENLIYYLHNEPFGRRRVMSDTFPHCGEIKQTLWSYTHDRGYSRFGRWDDTALKYNFSEWVPVNVSYNFRTISTAEDLNGIVEMDRYIVAVDNAINAPISGRGFLLEVKAHSHGWVIQNVYGLHNNPCHYFRIGNCTSQTKTNHASDLVVSWSDWKQTRTTDMIEHEDILTSGVNINQIVEPKTYTIGVTNSVNAPDGITNGYLLEVRSFNKGWLIQFATPIYPGSDFYMRTGQNTNINIAKNFASGLSVKWSPWQKLATIERVKSMIGAFSGDSSEKPCAGMNIVLLGDSIFGECQDETSVASFLSGYTGATVHNFAFGGTRIYNRRDGVWGQFDLSSIADSILSVKSLGASVFTQKQNAIDNNPGVFPSYFQTTLDKMKTFDWDSVDLVIVNSGTNDFGSKRSEGVSYDDYFNGCIKAELMESLRKICTGTGAKVLYVLPCYRDDIQESWFWETYDEDEMVEEHYVYFPQYINDLITYCSERPLHDNEWNYGTRNLPFINPYGDMGINQDNASKFTDDGVHPNENGRKMLARFIANTVRGM